jgi:hypothetical protein
MWPIFGQIELFDRKSDRLLGCRKPHRIWLVPILAAQFRLGSRRTVTRDHATKVADRTLRHHRPLRVVARNMAPSLVPAAIFVAATKCSEIRKNDRYPIVHKAIF